MKTRNAVMWPQKKKQLNIVIKEIDFIVLPSSFVFVKTHKVPYLSGNNTDLSTSLVSMVTCSLSLYDFTEVNWNLAICASSLLKPAWETRANPNLVGGKNKINKLGDPKFSPSCCRNSGGSYCGLGKGSLGKIRHTPLYRKFRWLMVLPANMVICCNFWRNLMLKNLPFFFPQTLIIPFFNNTLKPTWETFKKGMQPHFEHQGPNV